MGRTDNYLISKMSISITRISQDSLATHLVYQFNIMCAKPNGAFKELYKMGMADK